MEGVESSAREVALRMGDIVESSRSQASGIVEVNRAIEALESATHGNAQLAGQVAGDAVRLSTHAESLVAAVSRFSVAEELPEPESAPPTARSAALLPA
jgi:methyl-accepting chemotaxis protein